MFTVLDANERLDEIKPLFERLLRQRMKKPSFFIMATDSSNQHGENKYRKVRESLEPFSYRGRYVPLVELAVTARESGLTDRHLFPESIIFRCLALDLGASEQMRDKIKEALWKAQECRNNLPKRRKETRSVKCRLKSLASDLATSCRQRETTGKVSRRQPFNLRSHGLFIPATTRRVRGLRLHSFDHGGGHFYQYRLAPDKLASLSLSYPNLNEYLHSLFTDCPNHFFRRGPRISALRWPVRPSYTPLGRHPISRMTEAALSDTKYGSLHTNIEVYLLENDPGTIACEVPVWLELGELKEYAQLFSISNCLTGHIDIIRYEKNSIEIWDYKPSAAAEGYAGLQVFLYAVALSVRTNISLRAFLCGYFDHTRAYSFFPSKPEFGDETC